MPQSKSRQASLWMAAAVLAVAAGPRSQASTKVGTPVVALPNVYNYSPSVIQTGNIQQFWWCGQAQNPNDPSQNTDTIQYESINLQTHATVGPETVLGETPGAWDSAYTCNPKVVKGSFVNPLGNGTTYSYALYYVATNQTSGTLNSIGVAFSNDGISWIKYASNPVITYTAQDQQNNAYGVGQPAAYNSNGGSGIWIFYEGNSGQSHYEATSTDGVHFTTQGTLTTNGLSQVFIAGQSSSAPESWGDMAYDYQTGNWYAAYNMTVRPPSTTGGVTERGQLGIIVYRIPSSSLLSGATPWQQVFTVDTNLTGSEGNFIPSFLRDLYGNVNIGPYPQIEIYTSASIPVAAWNASPAARGNSNDVSHWVISWAAWSPNAALIPFNRYYGTVHEVTTGYVDTSVFHLEKTLGYLYESPQAGATTPLYGCVSGNNDYFVSPSSSCEGQLFLGINGYAFSSAQAGTVPLYRCYTGSDHFVSTDASCEGQHTEQLLGYAPESQ